MAKTAKTGKTGKRNFLTRILIAVLCLLVIVIGAGTIYRYIKGPPVNPANSVNVTAGGTPETESAAADDTGLIKTFSGIGTLRAQLKKEKNAALPATIVIEPYFSYNSADSAFYEELVKNTGNFREATIKYFQGLNAGSDVLRNDALLQKELLARYNDFLRLGKIGSLYFTNFMIIK